MPWFAPPPRRPARPRLGAGLLLVLCALGCEEAPDPLAPSSDGAQAAAADGVSLIKEPFSDIYRLFLMPQIPSNVKSARWNTNYQGRWVSWTGKLVAGSRSSAKFKQLQSTITFDVSMLLNRNVTGGPPRLRVGQFYTYVGRLRSYDDVFRTIYLDQGIIVANSESPRGELVPVPAPLRYYPGVP